MSRKVDQFKATLGAPLTINNFKVQIPLIDGENEILVQSTVLPQDELRVTTVKYWGETLNYPAIPESSHVWPVQIPETVDGRVFKDLCRSRLMWYEQYSGLLLLPTSLGQNIIVKMFNPVTQEDIIKVKLWNAFLVGIDPVQLNAAGSTTPVIYNAKFIYDWVQNNPD